MYLASKVHIWYYMVVHVLVTWQMFLHHKFQLTIPVFIPGKKFVADLHNTLLGLAMSMILYQYKDIPVYH